MDYLERLRNITREFVELQLKNNSYYELIREEYNLSSVERQNEIIDRIIDCWEGFYESYYSIYTIMDSIEDYMSMNNCSLDNALDSEYFEIKEF